MYQLIYTSAPRLLEAGKTGFGTLARSKDMPQPLVSYMERLSTFDRAAGIRALQFYSFFSQGSLMYHVFSRVADAGADYTGRTNHLAQHFAIECGTAEDMAAQLGTPAGILLALGPLWLRECDYQPRILDEADMPGNAPTSPTGAWQQLTGTPGCEKWLARHAYRNGACLRFREPADTQTFLKLMHDAQLCMPTKGWGRGFSSATVSNLSAQLFPVTALDTRQQAAGITCPPGCPALDIMPGMQPPPAQDDQPAPPPTPEQRSKPIPQVSAPPHAAPIPMETIGGEVETVLPVHPAAPGHPLPPGHAPSRTAPARQALKGKTGTTRKRKSGLPVPLLLVGGLAAGALCAVLFQGKSDKPAKPTRPDTAETSSTKEEIKKQDSSRSKLAEDYAKNTRPTQQEEQDTPAPTPQPQTQPSAITHFSDSDTNPPVAKADKPQAEHKSLERKKYSSAISVGTPIKGEIVCEEIKDKEPPGTVHVIFTAKIDKNILEQEWLAKYGTKSIIMQSGDSDSHDIIHEKALYVKFNFKYIDKELKSIRTNLNHLNANINNLKNEIQSINNASGNDLKNDDCNKLKAIQDETNKKIDDLKKREKNRKNIQSIQNIPNKIPHKEESLVKINNINEQLSIIEDILNNKPTTRIKTIKAQKTFLENKACRIDMEIDDDSSPDVLSIRYEIVTP